MRPLKFVAISDTHGCHRQLKNLPAGDILLHGGDICNRGDVSQATDFVDWFSEQDFQFKIFIGGNHDLDFETGECLVPRTLSDGAAFPENMLFLSDAGVTIGEVKIWGSSTKPKTILTSRFDWSAIASDTTILMTHYPPYSILDQNWVGKHCGSKSLLTRVREIEPSYHLFGDIHASYGQLKTNKTQFFNASLYRAQTDEIVNKPFVFEIG